MLAEVGECRCAGPQETSSFNLGPDLQLRPSTVHRGSKRFTAFLVTPLSVPPKGTPLYRVWNGSLVDLGLPASMYQPCPCMTHGPREHVVGMPGLLTVKLSDPLLSVCSQSPVLLPTVQQTWQLCVLHPFAYTALSGYSTSPPPGIVFLHQGLV